MKISLLNAKKKSIIFSEDAEKYVYEKLIEAYRKRDKTFGKMVKDVMKTKKRTKY